MEMSFDTVLKIGSLLGFSFIYVALKDTKNYLHSPKLKILKFDKNLELRTYFSVAVRCNWTRKFATIHVKNTHRTTAKRCVATLDFIECPKDVQLKERQYTLHWADIQYSARSTGAEPVDIGNETQRLDVVFTDKQWHTPGSLQGCLACMPLALRNTIVPQAVMPPGIYYVHIKISCENGKSTWRNYQITSPEINNPNDWEAIDFQETRGIKIYLKYLKAKLTRQL